MYDFKSYEKPRDLTDAIALLAANPDARLIAGGTDVLIKLHKGKSGFSHLVDIHDLSELCQIEISSDGDILIGSGVCFSTLADSPVIQQHIPLLAEAAGTVGGPQIRNMATIGGNVCNGVPSADGAIPLFCLNTALTLKGPGTTRNIPIHQFYLGPGKVDLKSGEILTCFTISRDEYEGMQGHYYKYAMREAMDIATIGCAAQCKVEKGVLADLRIAFGVAGPVPLRCRRSESAARGKTLSQALLTEISENVAQDLAPRDSWRASRDFRLHIIKTLAHRVVKRAVNRSGVEI